MSYASLFSALVLGAVLSFVFLRELYPVVFAVHLVASLVIVSSIIAGFFIAKKRKRAEVKRDRIALPVKLVLASLAFVLLQFGSLWLFGNLSVLLFTSRELPAPLARLATEINRPLEFLILQGPSLQSSEEIERTVNQLSRVAPGYVRVKKVDASQDLDLIKNSQRKFGERLVIRREDGEEVAISDTSPLSLAKALSRLVLDDPPVVYLLGGFGRSSIGDDNGLGFKALAETLRMRGFRVEAFREGVNPQPQKDVVIVPAPARDPGVGETVFLAGLYEKKIPLFFLCESAPCRLYQDIFDRFGIRFAEKAQVSVDQNKQIAPSKSVLLQDHQIGARFSRLSNLSLYGPYPFEELDPATCTFLATLTSETETLGAAAACDKDGRRAVFVGDSDFAKNSLFFIDQNRDFVLSVVEWLTESSTEDTGDAVVEPLRFIDNSVFSTYRLLLVFVPEFILLLGFIVLRKREG